MILKRIQTKSIVFLVILSAPLLAENEFDYLKPKHEQYQDIIINNVVVSKGARECASRYEALKPFLDKYKRPFTVLDIGASQGYFSFRIAHDYPQSTCVMIEGNYNTGGGWQTAEQLLDLCRLNTDLSNIVFLKKKISLDDLKNLASCEHFDVVLIFNVIHHMGSAWQEWAKTVFELGDNIVIETPPGKEKTYAQYVDQITAIENYCIGKGGIVLCETPRHTDPSVKAKTFLFEGKKEKLTRAYWTGNKTMAKKFKIDSSFDHKILIKSIKGKSDRITDWVPGINLLTFKMMNGSFPEITAIEAALKSLSLTYHPDPFLWNMCIKGQEIFYIDWEKLSNDYIWNSTKVFKYNNSIFKLSEKETFLKVNSLKQRLSDCLER